MIWGDSARLRKVVDKMAEVTLQEKVESFLKIKKMKKKDFAQKIGVSNVVLSHWLHGRVRFDHTTIAFICDAIEK